VQVDFGNKKKNKKIKIKCDSDLSGDLVASVVVIKRMSSYLLFFLFFLTIWSQKLKFLPTLCLWDSL
jgi:hypothetical protein